MSVDPNAGGGGPGVNVYIEAGKAIARWANRALGTGESKREAAQYDAAQRAGYTTRPGRFPVTYDPQGRITTPAKARDVGRVAIQESGRTSKEQAELDREYREAYRREQAETRQREREARKERERKRPASAPDAKRPQGRIGRIVDAATAVLIGSGVLDVIKNPPLPDIPPPPPADPGMGSPGEFDLPPKGGPFVPSVPPTLPPTQPEPAPPAPARVEPPAPVSAAAWEPVLTGVAIYRERLPLPSRPATRATAMPGGAPTTTGTTLPKVPLWKQALPYLAPLALTALAPSSSGKKRRDPLTVDQPDGLLSWGPASVPLPFPGSGFGGSGSGSSSSSCECKPKATRRRSKRKRDVCYSGRYIERSSGISKTKLRKVPCR